MIDLVDRLREMAESLRKRGCEDEADLVYTACGEITYLDLSLKKWKDESGQPQKTLDRLEKLENFVGDTTAFLHRYASSRIDYVFRGIMADVFSPLFPDDLIDPGSIRLAQMIVIASEQMVRYLNMEDTSKTLCEYFQDVKKDEADE